MQSHWQQHPQMQWAHANALAAPPRKIMSQSEAVVQTMGRCEPISINSACPLLARAHLLAA